MPCRSRRRSPTAESTKLDTAAAEKMPGVRAIFHRENIGKIFRSTLGTRVRRHLSTSGARRSRTMSFATTASTSRSPWRTRSRAAKAAADAVRVTYAKEKPNVETDLKADDEPEVVDTRSARASACKASAATPTALSRARRSSSTRPMSRRPRRTTRSSCTRRPRSGTARTLTLYESSQGVVNLRGVLAQMFGLPKENVRVITKFVGSGFGSKLWPWTHCPLAAAAARQLGKPVKLVRQPQDDVPDGRPSSAHPAARAARRHAGREARLAPARLRLPPGRCSMTHHEDCGEATPFHYSVPNLRVTFGRARRNVGSPTDMRGPGAVPGLYATESAMNELADQLKIDPVQLRVLNEPKIDESLGIPFSSRHLLECFELGAEKFGWSKRTPEVGSMKRDGLTLGWGMAGCAWIAARFPAEASVQLRDDGTARVACGTQDIGTGTYTILAQLASQKTGVPLDKVEVALGDTSLPAGPISGGSMATGSVVPAVFAAADNAIASLLNDRDDDAGIAVREAQARRSGVRRRPGLREGGRSRRRACRSRMCSGAPTCAWSPATASPKRRSAIPSRSSRRTRSAVTSSRSPGSRRSPGCASAAW